MAAAAGAWRPPLRARTSGVPWLAMHRSGSDRPAGIGGKALFLWHLAHAICGIAAARRSSNHAYSR
jgi:hypothetical protein